MNRSVGRLKLLVPPVNLDELVQQFPEVDHAKNAISAHRKMPRLEVDLLETASSAERLNNKSNEVLFHLRQTLQVSGHHQDWLTVRVITI